MNQQHNEHTKLKSNICDTKGDLGKINVHCKVKYINTKIKVYRKLFSHLWGSLSCKEAS